MRVFLEPIARRRRRRHRRSCMHAPACQPPQLRHITRVSRVAATCKRAHLCSPAICARRKAQHRYHCWRPASIVSGTEHYERRPRTRDRPHAFHAMTHKELVEKSLETHKEAADPIISQCCDTRRIKWRICIHYDHDVLVRPVGV